MDAGVSASAGRVVAIPVKTPNQQAEGVKAVVDTRSADRKLVRIQVPFYVSDDDAGRAKALKALGGEKAVHNAIREDSLGSLVCHLRPQDPQAHGLRPTFSQATDDDPALVFKVIRKNGEVVRTEVLGTLPAGGHATFNRLADFQFLHESSFQGRGPPSAGSAPATRTTVVADPVPFDPLPLYFAQHPQFVPPSSSSSSSPKNDDAELISVSSAKAPGVTTTSDAAVAQSDTSSQPLSGALPSSPSESLPVMSTTLTSGSAVSAKRPVKRKAETLAKRSDSRGEEEEEEEEEEEDEEEEDGEAEEGDLGKAHVGLLKEMQGVESYDLLM